MRKGRILLWGIFLVAALTAQNQKIEKINQQIQDIERKLQILKDEKGSLLNDIYEAELRYEKVKIESNRIELQLRETQQKIARKEREKATLALEIANSKTNIKKMVRILYKFGGNAYLKLFSEVNNLNQLFKNYRLFVSLIDYNLAEIERVKSNIAALEKVKLELNAQYARSLNLKKTKDANMRQLLHFKQGKIELIGRINDDKSHYLRLLDELKHEATRLNDFMNRGEAQAPVVAMDVSHLKGHLDWPISGRLISKFGRKKSTRFDTYIFNDGIEIRPDSSDDVRSVYNGEIVYADYFKGYGNLVIIRHSKNFHSLYGHCDQLLVKQGDYVNKGDRIALAGDTGSTFGKSLYFAIREDLKPKNPLAWLRKAN